MFAEIKKEPTFENDEQRDYIKINNLNEFRVKA